MVWFKRRTKTNDGDRIRTDVFSIENHKPSRFSLLSQILKNKQDGLEEKGFLLNLQASNVDKGDNTTTYPFRIEKLGVTILYASISRNQVQVLKNEDEYVGPC
jgi:hypothetical protein